MEFWHDAFIDSFIAFDCAFIRYSPASSIDSQPDPNQERTLRIDWCLAQSSAPITHGYGNQSLVSKLGSKTQLSLNYKLAPNNKRNKRCQQNIVRKNCPGLCQKRKCPCEDFPIPFQWGQFVVTCDSVAQLSKKKQKERCKRHKFQKMCPSVCDKRCRPY